MSRKKILVVDDSPTSQMWQRLILRPEPYEVVVATDGQAGVDAARALLPDLVLMDVMMPRLTGFEALRALRADPRTSALPVIMVTTRGDDASVAEGWKSGCNDYVTKPIDRDEYLAKVRGLLE